MVVIFMISPELNLLRHANIARALTRILRSMPARGSADRLAPDELVAWQGFLRANARLVRRFDADLRSAHGLSGSAYDVLIQLGVTPRRRLRMTALAEAVLMSPSGISRLVDELEREGLVARERSEQDARSFEVALTRAGRARLKAANRTHLRQVRELFLDRLSDDQLLQLADIWASLDPALTVGNAASANQ
jgi:DNA-binding MarR family transcriptional regulator